MSWNHRVMKSKDGEDDFYQIHEVFYDEDDVVKGYTKLGATAAGNTLEELRSELKRMLASLDKEILQYEEVD
jgi:hypothetical protein